MTNKDNNFTDRRSIFQPCERMYSIRDLRDIATGNLIDFEEILKEIKTTTVPKKNVLPFLNYTTYSVRLPDLKATKLDTDQNGTLCLKPGYGVNLPCNVVNVLRVSFGRANHFDATYLTGSRMMLKWLRSCQLLIRARLHGLERSCTTLRRDSIAYNALAKYLRKPKHISTASKLLSRR